MPVAPCGLAGLSVSALRAYWFNQTNRQPNAVELRLNVPESRFQAAP